ncbi:gliding motility-associated C-terminal domain-containing protein [Mucilaginibacter glaciei]|uniref:Gliding motility-associated C-terminal domain-containing protein n=1 Tax=Mucilaginibacter glaciei TaxID=2772109 RepID=A0A926NPL2_9SPHI|nr:gliding motility-associated C-terminal domain-containing protein [Mucilaginibacter glaciei]MBD1392732.1 gliding motility-associated C-terminal domain-containing protein [Mucilaginibacter glaciei]
MQTFHIKALLLLFFTVFAIQARAQLAGGSLGDPVINETFGHGATYGTTGPALPVTVTNVRYTTETCPTDGYYTIASGLGSCFGGTWQTVSRDHTGDANGYMMIINSSFDPSIFYVQKASGSLLCPNTNYQFSAWIMNVIRDRPDTRNHIRPNITFSIETVDGTVLKTYNTGDIPQGDFTTFEEYGTSFTTPSNGADIVVKMRNNARGGDGNDLILDDITFRPYGPTILAGFGDITSTTDRDLCEGESGTYILKASQVGYNDPYYQWQVNKNDGSGWKDVAGQTTTTLNVTLTNAVAGKNQYRIGVLNGPSAAITCRIYSQPLTVNVNAFPVVVIKPQTIVCEAQELRLTATGGDTYQWTGPNGFTSAEQSPAVSYSANNSFNGVYRVTVTTKGCVSTASTTVSVLPKVNPTISSDVAICAGSSTQLQAGGGVTYKWTPSAGLDHDDIANPMASPSLTTTYNVRVDNGGCIDESKSVTVTVLKLPAANAGKDVFIQEGESVTLQGTVAGDDIKYYWTPTENMDNPLSLKPVVSPTENTIYTLNAESQSNCGVVFDNVLVRVYKKITIPNSFTPNGDGVNDLWNIDQLFTYPESVLTIFTRNGSQVYRSIGYAKAWNGQYQGKALPVGTYYYTIDLKNNSPIRSGWVFLVR